MFQNIKVKGTTVCDCGRQFVITDIQKLEDIDDKHFYGGLVKYYSKAKCPKCGKEVILLLRQAGQTYEVVNIAEEIQEENKEVKEDNIETEKEAEENNKNTENEESLKAKTNSFVCGICHREFKSKSGLTSHLKTHNN